MIRAAGLGAALVLVYTGFISGADAITKLIAGGYAAPQLFALSGLVVVGLSVLADRHPTQRMGLRTANPGAMALRALATVVASLAFFQAFALLPFAEVFVFIGLMPLFAGLMSGPVLSEKVRASAWVALMAGAAGVVCLFPTGWQGVGAGHLWALLASGSGTFSLVLARRIGRTERNTLAQVFYPNAALCVVMALALPFVWRPMGAGDVALVLAYAALLFAARWVLVLSLRCLAAYAVTPLMNLQFVWMVAIGWLGFGEVPDARTYAGVAIVVGSGLFLLWDQMSPPAFRALRTPAKV